MIYQGETLSVSYLENGIAELRFDAPGSVNKLDRATLLSLSEAIAALQQERELKGLILTSGKDAFIVGADITEFLELFDLPQDPRRRRLCDQPGRRRQEFEGTRAQADLGLPRQAQARRRQPRACEHCRTAFLLAMRQRLVAVQPRMARADSPVCFSHRHAIAGAARAHAPDARLEGAVGRSQCAQGRFAVRRIPRRIHRPVA